MRCERNGVFVSVFDGMFFFVLLFILFFFVLHFIRKLQRVNEPFAWFKNIYSLNSDKFVCLESFPQCESDDYALVCSPSEFVLFFLSIFSSVMCVVASSNFQCHRIYNWNYVFRMLEVYNGTAYPLWMVFSIYTDWLIFDMKQLQQSKYQIIQLKRKNTLFRLNMTNFTCGFGENEWFLFLEGLRFFSIFAFSYSKTTNSEISINSNRLTHWKATVFKAVLTWVCFGYLQKLTTLWSCDIHIVWPVRGKLLDRFDCALFFMNEMKNIKWKKDEKKNACKFVNMWLDPKNSNHIQMKRKFWNPKYFISV